MNSGNVCFCTLCIVPDLHRKAGKQVWLPAIIILVQCGNNLGWSIAREVLTVPLQKMSGGIQFDGTFACGEASPGTKIVKSLQKKSEELPSSFTFIHLAT